MIIPDGSLGLGSSTGTPMPDEIYSEIMAAIGDPVQSGQLGLGALGQHFELVNGSVLRHIQVLLMSIWL